MDAAEEGRGAGSDTNAANSKPQAKWSTAAASGAQLRQSGAQLRQSTAAAKSSAPLCRRQSGAHEPGGGVSGAKPAAKRLRRSTEDTVDAPRTAPSCTSQLREFAVEQALEALLVFCAMHSHGPAGLSYSQLRRCATVSKTWRSRVQTALRLLSCLHMDASCNTHGKGTPLRSAVETALKQVGPGLTSLHLEGGYLLQTAPDATRMLTLLSAKAPALTSLSICGDNTLAGRVKPAAHAPLAQAIYSLSCLEMLKLSNNRILFPGARRQELAVAIGSLPRLRHLDLSGNEVHPYALEDALSRASLTHLDLRAIAVTFDWLQGGHAGPENLSGLESALRRQTKLEVLDLGGNHRIPSSAGQVLARALRGPHAVA